MYLMVNFSLLLPLLFMHQSRRWRLITLGELVLVIAGALMTGSRSVVLAQILLAVGYFAIYGVLRPVYSLSIAARFLIPASLVAGALLLFFRPAIDSFMYRVSTSDSITRRIAWNWTTQFGFIEYTGLHGYGMGATHAGRQALQQSLGLPDGEVIPIAFEPEMGRVMLELGPFGFVLWYGLRLYLAFLHWRLFLKLRTPLLRNLALSAFLVSITHVDAYVISNPTLTIYYWFLNSFIILLPRLERQKANAIEQQPLISQPQHRIQFGVPRLPQGVLRGFSKNAA